MYGTSHKLLEQLHAVVQGGAEMIGVEVQRFPSAGDWRGILLGKVQCFFPNHNLLTAMLLFVYVSMSYNLIIYMLKVWKGNLNFQRIGPWTILS